MNEDAENDHREYEKLSKCVIPLHYDLFLKPDLYKCTFEGKVIVNLKVTSETNSLHFHSTQLDVSDVHLQTEDGVHVPTNPLNFDKNDSVIVLGIPHPLASGLYKLSMKFQGSLDDNLRGFYRAKYKSIDGEERYCAMTQFEASKAHRCFPCWDEPAFKATFDVTVSVPRDRVALSNMPILSEKEDKDGNRVVQFCTSPIMSTYLLAVVIGEFDYIEQSMPNGVIVRIYTPCQKQEQGRFALDAAVKVLPYFEDFFKISYPLPKLDLIAVPCLSFGAMENWGLITFRETELLVDPNVSSTKRIQSIALTVAHEIAHQWFGNLVTMEWWDHLWLNEGYATFMEFLSVANIFPHYNIWNDFIAMRYGPAMKMDSLRTSHPVEVHVNHPLHVDEIFDDISYNKGASLVRMVYKYIGEEDFSKGMNMYLSKYQYKNASTDDLWKVLEEASNKPISLIMPKWTRKMGYPFIAVEREQTGNSCKLHLKQFKFCSHQCNSDLEEEIWIIPIEYKSSKSQKVHQILLKSKEETLTIEGVCENDWIKLNPSRHGFYRVQYSIDMLANLIPVVSDLSLPPLDRLGLLDDLFSMVQAGHASTDKVFELLLAMSCEDSRTVWSTMSSVLFRLKKLVDYLDSSTQENFIVFGQRLLQNVRKSVTWIPQPNESHEEQLLRILVLDLLGEFEDEATICEAKKLLEAHLNSSSILPPDLRSVVYSMVLKNADLESYKSFLEMYRNSTFQEEKERILYALASMKDENLIGELLKFAMSDEVRKETSLYVLSAVSQSRTGREQVWAYTQLNWNSILEGFAGTFAVPRLVQGLFSYWALKNTASCLEQFCKENTVVGVERTISQAIERIHINADWLERDQKLITLYLKNMQDRKSVV